MRSAVRWLASRGELVRVLPGCFVSAAVADDPAVRALALVHYLPDAVLIGRSAAMLTGWADQKPTVLTAAVPRQVLVPRGYRGYHWTRRRIDPDWVTHSDGIACTNQFLTAVDLIPELGGEFVDDVLRRHPGHGAWALEQLWSAFHAHPGRRGNADRREVLRDSRDRPWSEAERKAHCLLRDAGLTFQTNHAIRIDGETFFLDVALPELRLGIELNGFERHGRREVFENDHRRRNAVHLAGWLILEFTWRMITDHPDRFVETVLRAIAQR
ncbi:DUF559 domain-containing protein [Enemella evansiae]|uniref:DUF559 domain-containing protein n=1 Tax=Enemella evansiae TaxID=2016499 RepID=UPI000B97121D|nr:DUF559 domain-containing protein [Enemella evansiae]OYO03494.1 hypothetical protein CGZ97_08585 [Enemella evansiae]